MDEQELRAVVEARKELGPEHEGHLIESFLAKMDKEIDRRVDERIAARGPRRRSGSALHPANLALCIPIVAIAGGIGHTAGLVVAFLALVAVFALSELRR